MTELDLYKFINDNNIEWHWENNDGTPDVLIFPYIFQLEEFQKMLSATSFDDGGIQCRMMNGYFAFWMNDICDHYGIEIEKVFVKEEQD